MKKLLAIALVWAFMLSSFTARAEATDPSVQTLESSNTQADENKEFEWAWHIITAESVYQALETSLMNSLEPEQVEDGKLTIDMIRQMPSWEVLLNTTDPMDNYKNIKNAEDLYAVMFIESCDHRLVAPVYHDQEYVSYGLRGIRLNDIDYDRLMDKFQAIIDVYNKSNDLQLTWTSKILNEDYMQVDINSDNVFPVITAVGQSGILREGAIYWESSWNDGSGKYGIATTDNCYISKDFVVTVNGFAYLDESRTNIIQSYYIPYEEIGEEDVQIMPWERRMLHICTENGDLGWVYAEDVERID